MPPDPVRPVRLFYDPTCGPCRFLASAAEGLSRGRLESVAFDGPDARVALEDLSEEMRFGAAHVVTADERRSGAEIVGPLVATTFGPRLGGLYDLFPTLARPLHWIYWRLWENRRRSCESRAPA
ncbi:MAG: hypothetical protein WBG19_05070 [Thermoplasmata archaeon]